ncbi:MAG: retropepsin-like aspartic protease [Candidatus Nezhaarchaeales archaeon]
MRASKAVELEFMGERARCTALFDTGSGVTVIQRAFFEEVFGAKWLRLSRPLKLCWINGNYIEADKYAQLAIIIDGFELPETVFVIDEFVKEIEVEGGKIRLPELIVGSGTMDKYGIVLDPKEGIKIAGATLVL